MKNEQIFYHLAELMKRLDRKNLNFLRGLRLLESEIDSGILEEFISDLELPLVLAAGGTQKHYEFLSSSDLFMYYRNEFITKEDLLEWIEHAIKYDRTKKTHNTF